eukprot:m.479474 g.479474  ORF g.479474 m.479474 type:complete len:87 (+) comp49865_c0_seq1:181-441(+)
MRSIPTECDFRGSDHEGVEIKIQALHPDHYSAQVSAKESQHHPQVQGRKSGNQYFTHEQTIAVVPVERDGGREVQEWASLMSSSTG